MPDLEMFRCEPLSAHLTRRACAARHRQAVRAIKAGTSTPKRGPSDANLRCGPCGRCPVGAAHAAGEAPDAETMRRKLDAPIAAPPREETPVPEKTCQHPGCEATYVPGRRRKYCADHRGPNAARERRRLRAKEAAAWKRAGHGE